MSTSDAPAEECPAGGTVVALGDESFTVCNGVAGNDGVDGDMGEPGAQGEPGAMSSAAAGLPVKSTIFCSGSLVGTVMHAQQQVTVFEDNSLLVSVTITNGVTSATSVQLYPAARQGADNASVTLVYDTQGPTTDGVWDMFINTETWESTITYTDVDWTNNNVWVQPVSSCIINGISCRDQPEECMQ